MSRIDFQNGFAIGLTCGGTVSEGASDCLDYTVKFFVDGELYEVVSVKSGNLVNTPTQPTKEGCVFRGWFDANNNPILLPFTPTTDITITGFMLPFSISATFEYVLSGNDDFLYRTMPTNDIISFFNSIKEGETYLMSVDDSEFFEVTPVFVGSWKALFDADTLTGAGYNTATNEFGAQMNETNDLSGHHTITFNLI